MGCTVVDAQTGGESHSTLNIVPFLQALMPSQCSNTVLNSFSNFSQALARLDILLCPLSDLSVNLRCLPVFIQKVIVHTIQMSFLFVGCPVAVLVSILGNFSFRILTVWKQIRDRDSWRHSLRFATTDPSFLFLRLPPFLLFGS